MAIVLYELPDYRVTMPGHGVSILLRLQRKYGWKWKNVTYSLDYDDLMWVAQRLQWPRNPQ